MHNKSCETLILLHSVSLKVKIQLLHIWVIATIQFHYYIGIIVLHQLHKKGKILLKITITDIVVGSTQVQQVS